MNKADSEKIALSFESKGYLQAKSAKDTDVVIINTCSVRQSAEDRVLGLVNNLSKIKSKKRRPKIILTGCMLRYPLPRLKKMLSAVDEFIKLKDLIGNIPPYASSFAKTTEDTWVTIMEGCDNYCTYCVVPYSRGREVSRPMEEIICEVKELVKRGIKEITLLGQNVNSYGKKHSLDSSDFSDSPDKPDKSQFAKLLKELHKIKGLKKISFLTSNPQDLTDDIIEAMKLPKIVRYLHLPVQSGDDGILKKMNRQYTAKQYLNLIKKIRHQIPEIEIGTDIIVGFPGETRLQFQNTVALCKKARFKVAYVAKYSPRWGTAAFKLEDNVSPQEKKRRWRILDKLINKK